MSNNFSIKLQNTNVFQRENLVLANVNLEIEKGEFVYLVGKVGSGKSSLIKTLNAELPLVDGNAIVAGYELGKIKNKEIPFLRRKLGVVFQDFKLLTDRNVYDNLLFVLKATGWTDKKLIEEKIDEILNEVGMIEAKLKMPHQLSGGEQQRIVIARALLNNPEIILADEPTGNLDPETSIEIAEIFQKFNNEGKTVVMATHDKPIVEKFPHRTIFCLDGKLQEDQQGELLNFREVIS